MSPILASVGILLATPLFSGTFALMYFLELQCSPKHIGLEVSPIKFLPSQRDAVGACLTKDRHEPVAFSHHTAELPSAEY